MSSKISSRSDSYNFLDADLIHQLNGTTYSPSQALENPLEEPSYLNIGRAYSAPLYQQIAKEKAKSITALIMQSFANNNCTNVKTTKSSPKPEITIHESDLLTTAQLEEIKKKNQECITNPCSRLNNINSIISLKTSSNEKQTVQANSIQQPLFSNEERIDQEPSPLTPALNDYARIFPKEIDELKEKQQLSEKEAVVAIFCRTWAVLNGFPVKPL